MPTTVVTRFRAADTDHWRSAAVTAALAIVIGAAVLFAATLSHYHRLGTGGEATKTAERPVPLRLGRESMFSTLNVGDIATARALLANVWPERGHAPAHLGWPLTWHENPDDDAYFRFQFYGLQPTSNLLWAYARTHDRRYRDRLLAILRSYIAYDRTRPYDRLTFDNPHAAAFRAMVLANTYVKLQRSHDLPPKLAAGMRVSLAKLGDFLAYRYHAFESWVNHGFNEGAALLLIADNFPQMRHATAWRALGVQRLRRMLELDIDRDGVDVENSPFYHLYVLGIVAQIAAWAQDNEPSLATPYRDAARRMLRYAGALTLPDGRLPMLGATAQTRVPQLDPFVYADLEALDPTFSYAYSGGERGTPPPSGAALFPTSGLFVIRSRQTADRLAQAVATFDAGAYRTEHSDLDALSLTLFAGGREILPDSGLFTYLAGQARDYFHGTRSHNTVVVDGRDQRAGNAIPGGHGTTAGGGWAQGTSRLYSGVRHQRTVVVLTPSLTLVLDRLASARAHVYAQTWHLPPLTHAHALSNRRLSVTDPDGNTALLIAQAGAPERPHVVEGRRKPMQGWISEAYGVKVPSPAVEYRVRRRSATFVTALATGEAAATPLRLAEKATPRGSTISVCAADVRHLVEIPSRATASEPVVARQGGTC